jgi:signal transduction histidine kinase
VLEAALKEWGYEVVVTSNGDEAWEVLREKSAPRIAILDWVMPGLDGIEVCKRTRALQREEPTYLILLTVKGGRENILTAFESGADDYIHKPFDRDELHARLKVARRIVGLQASLAARVVELEQALTEAQKMEAIGRLAGGVAHDFNNLLTVILGNCELLLARVPAGSPERDLLQTARLAGERGAGLTRQLLAFSRKQVLTPAVLNLNDLVTNVEGILRRLIGEDVRLASRLAPDLRRVKADAGQVEQVLMNLAVNARDAMPHGGEIVIETGNVDLDEDYAATHPGVVPGPHVLLAVSDTGCGMDKATRLRIFEPFFTTKGPGKGTGLGLATVYGIVKQSDGHITVESEPGQGATFRVYLPQARGAAPQPRPSEPGTRPAHGSEVVLLVEDEDGVRRLARHILQAHKYTVLEAPDGLQALEVSAAWNDRIDLLVTDVVMPSMSGHQLADRLCPGRPAMKVLYMSGYTDDAIVQHRVLEPGNHFLQKPFRPGELAAKVREVLDA